MDTKKNNSKAQARAIIAAASKTQLTLTGEAVVRHTVMFMGFVLTELNEAKKHLVGITSQDLIQEVHDFMKREKSNTVYASDRALLTDYYRSIRNYAWYMVNQKEAEFIIDQLKTSEQFCSTFFYGNSEKKGVISMGSIVSKICYQMLSSYHISIDKREVSSIIYEFFWDEGRWSALDDFRFESSFFSWIETISRREVIKKLEDLGLIKIQKNKTSGNQRHVLLSQTPERCKLLIEDEVKSKKDRQILSYVYYNRYDDETIRQLLNMEEDTYAAARKNAEKRLIEAMLQSTKSYDNILRHKNPRDITVSIDAATDILNWVESKVGESALQDIFGINLTDKEIEECAQNVLSSVSSKMPWKERDRYIFRNRYFGGKSPVELAETLHVTRAYIDTRFSRLQERFNKALRQWAINMKLLSTEDVANIELRIKMHKTKERTTRESGKAQCQTRKDDRDAK